MPASSTFFHHLGKIIPCNFHSNEKGVTNFFQEGKTILFFKWSKKSCSYKIFRSPYDNQQI